MIRACIFDLDGVIVDTARYHYLAWQRLAKELGSDLSLAQNERLKGVSRMESLRIVLEIAGAKLSEDREEDLAKKKNEWFVEYVEAMRPSEIFPGVSDLIQALRKTGIKVALASSSKNAPRVIELLGIGSLFDAIVDGSMIVETKPDPEIFLLASQMVNVKPGECLVFEDAEAGVKAALRGGMKCVGVGSAQQLGKAHLVIPQTGDFSIDLLKKF